MKTVTEFPRRVVEYPDIRIAMSDGCRLSARVWMPHDAADHPVPAILEYIPYRKRDGTAARDSLMHPYFAGHGYACLRVDIRGNGDSDGIMTDEYTQQELADACEVIAWAAAQPWCTGRVGMMGKSWGGFNCLQTAVLRPPALAAVVTVCSTVDRFADDIHFKGGCLMGENFGWGSVMLSYSSRPPDPALRDDWRSVWLERLAANPHLAPRWASHQARDAYWQHGSICEDWGAIEVPVLSWGGWMDGYLNTVAHLVENLSGDRSEQGRTEMPGWSGRMVKGIVGPWVHQYAHQAVPGPAIGFLDVALRWWDRWMKDVPNGAEDDPAMRMWLRHAAPPDACLAEMPGEWIATAWPAGTAAPRHLHLAGNTLGDMPAALDQVIDTPQHLGVTAGEYFPMGLDAEMPGDQRADDALSVCFDTAPLADVMTIVGIPRLRLRLSSDKPLAFVVARLCVVMPDGSSTRVTHGMLNLCHRDSMQEPSEVPVGQQIDVEVVLDLVGVRVLPGQRLRLALSTTYWPFLWPSPDRVRLQLSAGTLDLPVCDTAFETWAPPVPAAAPAARISRAPTTRRRITEHDMLGETRTLIVEDDSNWVTHLDHGLQSRTKVTERFEITPNDPESARSTCHWKQESRRVGWHVETEVTTAMTADASTLHFHSEITARENGTVIFHKTDDQAVARRFV